jgi:hypothetical protein
LLHVTTNIVGNCHPLATLFWTKPSKRPQPTVTVHEATFLPTFATLHTPCKPCIGGCSYVDVLSYIYNSPQPASCLDSLSIWPTTGMWMRLETRQCPKPTYTAAKQPAPAEFPASLVANCASRREHIFDGAALGAQPTVSSKCAGRGGLLSLTTGSIALGFPRCAPAHRIVLQAISLCHWSLCSFFFFFFCYRRLS